MNQMALFFWSCNVFYSGQQQQPIILVFISQANLFLLRSSQESVAYSMNINLICGICSSILGRGALGAAVTTSQKDHEPLNPLGQGSMEDEGPLFRYSP